MDWYKFFKDFMNLKNNCSFTMKHAINLKQKLNCFLTRDIFFEVVMLFNNANYIIN